MRHCLSALMRLTLLGELGELGMLLWVNRERRVGLVCLFVSVEMMDFFGFVILENKDSFMKSKVWEDNNGFIATCHAPKFSPCTKHNVIKSHFVRNDFSVDPKVPKDHPLF